MIAFPHPQLSENQSIKLWYVGYSQHIHHTQRKQTFALHGSSVVTVNHGLRCTT